MAKFINLIVTNGGLPAEEGYSSSPSMNGDNLINNANISFVRFQIQPSAYPNSLEIWTNFLWAGSSSLAKYTLQVSKAQTGDPSGAANKPSAAWMSEAKKAITAAISNQAPGGTRTNVVLPKDGNDIVYFRAIQMTQAV